MRKPQPNPLRQMKIGDSVLCPDEASWMKVKGQLGNFQISYKSRRLKDGIRVERVK